MEWDSGAGDSLLQARSPSNREIYNEFAFQINTLLIHYSAANCAHSYQPTGGIFDNDSKTLRDRWIPRGDRNNKASDEKTLITFWMEPRPSPFTPRQNQRERESRRDVTDEQNNMAD